MLCPKVWNLKPSKHQLKDVDELKNREVLDCINTHYFNHSISVVFPNLSNFAENFNQNILEDSNYYKAYGVRIIDLIDKEFIEAFVKKGEITLLSINNKIDVDNVLAITPTGHLILSLLRDAYQKLGIEGKPTFFERKCHSRYVVTIDLKDQNFTPGKKKYDKIRNSLDKMQDFVFSIIVAWDPFEDNVCPSSVAAWFERRLKIYLPTKPVEICHLQTIQRSESSLYIPTVESNFKLNDFFEWIGLFSIDAKLLNGKEEEKYVSSYVTPSPNVDVKRAYYRQYNGFFTRQKIKEIYKLFKDYTFENSESLKWCSIHVQGFSDSPVSWNLKEHTFYVDGDNSYTIVNFSNGNRTILRKSDSCNNKPRIKQ